MQSIVIVLALKRNLNELRAINVYVVIALDIKVYHMPTVPYPWAYKDSWIPTLYTEAMEGYLLLKQNSLAVVQSVYDI